jgi:hypothetical protein
MLSVKFDPVAACNTDFMEIVMAIDYENTSFAFNRRREFVGGLLKTKADVEQRLRVPGRESLLKLAQLLEALNHVLADEVFQPHVLPQAEAERVIEPAAK